MAIYVHIGLPRAASTTLQTAIFPNIDNVAYLGVGKSNVPGLAIPGSLFSGLWRADEKGFEELSSIWASKLNFALKYAESERKDIVVSFEGWCRPSSNVEIGQLADRIFHVFRNPIIIFLLREPVNWLKSCYAKVVWNQFRMRDIADPLDLSTIEKYYEHIISDSGKFFGACGVEPWSVLDAFSKMERIVLPAEHLIENKFRSISEINNSWRISDLAIEKHNERKGFFAMLLARLWFRWPPWLRRCTRPWIINYAPKIDDIFKLKENNSLNESLRVKIVDEYAKNFERVNKLSAISLESYNYCKSESPCDPS